MYGPGPKLPPLPSVLQADSNLHLEEQALADLREEDKALTAYEEVPEFFPIPRADEERCEWEWLAMERDSVFVEWGRR